MQTFQLLLLLINFLKKESNSFQILLKQQVSLNLSKNEIQNDREWRKDKKIFKKTYNFSLYKQLGNYFQSTQDRNLKKNENNNFILKYYI